MEGKLGVIADMLLEGALCSTCGIYIDNKREILGFPIDCKPCSKADEEE